MTVIISRYLGPVFVIRSRQNLTKNRATISVTTSAQTTNVDELILSQQIHYPKNNCDSKALICEYQRSFVNVSKEVSMWISEDMITGKIPTDIEGTQFRNGPAFFERNGVRQNFLDGDGMINKFSIKHGKFHYMNKFIRTKEYVAESAADKFLYRTIFSNNDYIDIFNTFKINGLFKNSANTGVLCWGGKLFALHETSPPYELDPHTLRTLGQSSVFGTLLPKNQEPFAAHFRIITEKNNSKRWISFQPKIEGLDSNIVFLEFSETKKLVHKLEYKIENAAFAFFHDLLVTENYYVLYENPTKLNFEKVFSYLFNMCASSELFQFRRELPGKFHFVPRPGKLGTGIKIVDVPNGFIFHQSNAYETDGGKQIVLDAMAIDSIDLKTMVDNQNPDYFQLNQPPFLKRFVFDLEKQTLVEDAFLTCCACENPQINPEFTGRQNQHTYVFGTEKTLFAEPYLWAPFQIISKVSTPLQYKNSNTNKFEIRQLIQNRGHVSNVHVDNVQNVAEDEYNVNDKSVHNNYIDKKRITNNFEISQIVYNSGRVRNVRNVTDGEHNIIDKNGHNAHIGDVKNANNIINKNSYVNEKIGRNIFVDKVEKSDNVTTYKINNKNVHDEHDVHVEHVCSAKNNKNNNKNIQDEHDVHVEYIGSAKNDKNNNENVNSRHSIHVEHVGNAKNITTNNKNVHDGHHVHVKHVDDSKNGNIKQMDVQIDSWFAGDRKFVSEVIFIPRKNSSKNGQVVEAAEDDGYISTLVYTPHERKTEFVILDAKRVSDGPIATITLPIFIPIVLHGSWCDTCYAN